MCDSLTHPFVRGKGHSLPDAIMLTRMRIPCYVQTCTNSVFQDFLTLGGPTTCMWFRVTQKVFLKQPSLAQTR